MIDPRIIGKAEGIERDAGDFPALAGRLRVIHRVVQAGMIKLCAVARRVEVTHVQEGADRLITHRGGGKALGEGRAVRAVEPTDIGAAFVLSGNAAAAHNDLAVVRETHAAHAPESLLAVTAGNRASKYAAGYAKGGHKRRCAAGGYGKDFKVLIGTVVGHPEVAALIKSHIRRITDRFDDSAITERNIRNIVRIIRERDALILVVLLNDVGSLLRSNRRIVRVVISIENVRVSDRGGDAVVGRCIEDHRLVEVLTLGNATAFEIGTVSPIGFIPVALGDDQRHVGGHLPVYVRGVEHAEVDNEVADVVGFGVVATQAAGVACPVVRVIQEDWRGCGSAGAH